MHSRMFRAGAMAAALAGAAAGARAGTTDITNAGVASLGDVTAGLTALDLNGRVSGLTTSSSLTATFSTVSSTGSLTARVFGNVAAPGSGLNTVVIVYEFVGHGPSGIQQFMFGAPSGGNLDLGDLTAATQGAIGDLTSASQTIDGVSVVDNSAAAQSDLYVFDFAADHLGGIGRTDRFGWYVRASGHVQIGRAPVLISSFGGTTVEMLALVNQPGQPDLVVAVPLPGAVGLGLAGLVGVASRRRRATG